MKILGAGLSRTGTLSLHTALEILGFKSLHYDTIRLNDVLDGSNPRPDFRRYDDIDAVLDLPAAYFYEELTAAYPGCKCILTVRNLDHWWKSICRHVDESDPTAAPGLGLRRGAKRMWRKWTNQPYEHLTRDYNRFRHELMRIVYGSAIPHEYTYKRKYQEHNERVQLKIPPEQLLVMDISAGDGWDKLCGFLGVDRPPVAFPHKHSSAG